MYRLLKDVRPKAIARNSSAMLILSVLALSFPFARHAFATMSEPDPQADSGEEALNAEPKAVRERSAAIEAELKKVPDHAWAGEYYEGDGLGMNVRMLVSPVAGVTATWHGCLGLYGANEGPVQAAPDGVLHLAFAKENEGGFGQFPNDVMPVRWGERRYLIPPSRMSDFVVAINQGYEPRAMPHGQFLMASGDEFKHVDGLPELPELHKTKIRAQPLVASVIDVQLLSDKPILDSGMCDKSYSVDMEVMGEGPVQPGDVFKTEIPGNALADLTVVSVDGDRVAGVVKTFEADCKKPRSVPDRHWKFTTGAYNVAAANREIDRARERYAED